MKNLIKNIWKRLVKWYKEDPDEKEEEKEFEKFSNIIYKRIKNLNIGGGWANQNQKVEIAIMIQNAITQRKIVEANNSLKAATWILAFATIAFTIGTVYGVAELNNAVQISLQIFLGIIVIGLALFVLSKTISMLKFVLDFIRKKK